MSNIPPIPGTLPQDWITFVNSAINTQLPISVDLQALDITNTQQLIEYMDSQGWKPLIEVSEHIAGWVKDTPANAAETTDIAIRPVFDIVAGGTGGAATELISRKGAVSLVSKAIVLATCMSLFVSSLTPLGTEEQEDYKQAILDAITPFTIDGEHVPVFVDEDGKTYLSDAILEGVRAALVELGTYNTSEVINAQYSYTNVAGCTGYLNLQFTGTFTKQQMYNLLSSINEGQVTQNVLNGFDANVADDIYLGFAYGQVNIDDYKFRRTVQMFKQDTSTETMKYVYCMFERPNGGRMLAVYTYNPTTTTPEQLISNFRTAVDSFTPTSSQPTISGMTKRAVYYYNSAGNNVNNPIYAHGSKTTNDSYVNKIQQSIYSPLTTDTALVFGFSTSGEGVPGIDVTDKEDFGNLSITLENAIQGLADRAIELANPTDEDMTNKDTWYPVNLNADDVFTDGLTDAQTDPQTNTQGDPDTDSKDDIIDSLIDLIREITGSPDLPDIPAGDSGNTPPAEPPVLNGSSNGLWTMYNPTKQQVNDFGAWLWSDTLIDQIIRQFNSPIDAVIGFHQIYCTPITGSQKIIKAGYLDSPVSAAEVTNQYVDIDCGQVSVNEYYGNALDYDNTQVSLFLPFVGIVPLNTNVVMGSILHVIYRIDVFTGTCLAQVKVIKENSNAVMYAFEGNCAVQIPLTGTTYTGMVGALLGGLSASVSFMAGDMFHAGQSALSAIASAGTGLTGVKQSGTMGANAGSLGIRIPYLIITRSASAMPAGFESVRGIPSTELVTLGSVSGYTSVRDIHLEGIPATAEEINEIKELLSEGVIL